MSQPYLEISMVGWNQGDWSLSSGFATCWLCDQGLSTYTLGYTIHIQLHFLVYGPVCGFYAIGRNLVLTNIAVDFLLI